MTEFRGYVWRAQYGEIGEIDKFRIGYNDVSSFEAVFPIGQLADLISVLSGISGQPAGTPVKGTYLQARKYSDGSSLQVDVSNRSDANPVLIFSVAASDLTDLVSVLTDLSNAVPGSKPADWDNSHVKKIPETQLPDRLSEAELSATIAQVGRVLNWAPADGATAAENRASLQSAVGFASSMGLSLKITESAHIAGGHVLVSSRLTVIWAEGVTLYQDTRGKAIFKVTAADCKFVDPTFEGAGLDVTGLPLFGADSFRQHVGIWATLTAHHLTVTRITARNIVCGIVVGDFQPGETPSYSAPGLVALRVEGAVFEDVWVGIGGGPVVDPAIIGVMGNYKYVTGTPTNGDIGSPPHLVYFSSDTEHPSFGGFYDKIVGSDVENAGGVLKLKHMSGFTVGSLVARGTRGLLELEECSDFNIESLISTEDGYLDTGSAYGRGSIWLVECKNGTLGGINITFAEGTHGHAVWTNGGCEDIVFERPTIVARRSVASASVRGILDQGKRTKIIEPTVRSERAAILAGVTIAGRSQMLVRPRTSGAMTNAVNGTGALGVIDYDPIDIMPSRSVTPSRTFQVSGAPASEQPIYRDRSVGQVMPVGFTDDFTAPGRVSLASTDDRKAYAYVNADGVSGGTWVVSSGLAKFAGGTARGMALVDGGKADGTLAATIGALPTGDEGLVIRALDQNNYIAVIPYSGGSNVVKIIKRVAGAVTGVATSSVVAQVGDVLSVEATGTSIVAKLNGATVASGTVSELSTATKCGLIGTSTQMLFGVSNLTFG